MIRKYLPQSYDHTTGQVTECGEEWKDGYKEVRNGSCKVSLYVEHACIYYRRYADPDMLLWAIEHAWPAVSDNEKARVIFAELVEKNTLGKRGVKTTHALRADAAAEWAYALVWYYHGQGYAFYNSPTSNSDKPCACSLAGIDVKLSASRVHDIWLARGGKEPVGVQFIVAKMAEQSTRKPSPQRQS